MENRIELSRKHLRKDEAKSRVTVCGLTRSLELIVSR